MADEPEKRSDGKFADTVSRMMTLIYKGQRLMKTIDAHKWFKGVVGRKLKEITNMYRPLVNKMNRMAQQTAKIKEQQPFTDNEITSLQKEDNAYKVKLDEAEERNRAAKTAYLNSKRQKESIIWELEVKLGLSSDFSVDKRFDWSY